MFFVIDIATLPLFLFLPAPFLLTFSDLFVLASPPKLVIKQLPLDLLCDLLPEHVLSRLRQWELLSDKLVLGEHLLLIEAQPAISRAQFSSQVEA